MRMFWVSVVACALMLPSGGVMAGSGDSAQQVQASMVVTGTIVITPDGSVARYALNKKSKLPPGVLTELAKAVPTWKFQPVLRQGNAVMAKSHMDIRLVARPIGHGADSISVSGAYFRNGGKPGNTINYMHRSPPYYPRQAVQARVSGVVYLLLEVDRKGLVQHVAAQQVDLRDWGLPRQMKQARRMLAKASIRAARHWTFNIPVEGPSSGRNHWFVRVPVTFNLNGPWHPVPGYGQWRAYIPGPKRYIPWADRAILAGGADDVPANGGVYSMRQSLHLLTPLGGGS